MKKITVILLVLTVIISINHGCSKKRDPSPVGPLVGTATAPATAQATATGTVAVPATPTRTPTQAATAQASATRTVTLSATAAGTRTPTLTHTPTTAPTPPPFTPTMTRTPGASTQTFTPTRTPTRTFTPTRTATSTFTLTVFATPTNTATVTPTALVIPGLWVNASIELEGVMDMGFISMTMSEDVVSLAQGGPAGPVLTGATVAVQGTTLTDNADGTYSYSTSAIRRTPGTVISLDINSSSGNGSSSLTVPPSVSISSPAAGSSVSTASGFSINWAYTGGTPTGVTLMVADSYGGYSVTEYLGGAVTSYNVGAGVALTGTATVVLITQASSPITGATAGGMDFMYIYEVLNYISVLP